MFDPYTGYAPAQDLPNYYNPYKAYSAQNTSMQQAQQAGQAGVPGRDTPTPGSKHGPGGSGGRKIRIASPWGEVREVPEDKAQMYVRKGGRIV